MEFFRYINFLSGQKALKRSAFYGCLLFLFSFQAFGQGGFSCIKLYQVNYSSKSSNCFDIRSDNDSISYSKDHWQDTDMDGNADGKTDHKYPVCYKRGSKIAVKAKFKITPAQAIPSGFKVKIKGACASSSFKADLPEKNATVSSTEMEYPETEASKALPDSVGFLDPLTITWSISFDDGKTWGKGGVNENQVYVLFNKPSGGAQLFHTCVHIGCTNAANQTDEKQVVDKTYSEFQDQSVRRVGSSKDMTYWDKMNPAPEPACWNTAGLLKYGDARCGGWADFFKNTLGCQGITSQDVEIQAISGYTIPGYVHPRIAALGADYKILTYIYMGKVKESNYMFYVKTWDNVVPDKFAIDKDGVAGQGNTNPRSYFDNHAVVKYKTTYYDPSYGSNTKSTKLIWEDESLDGFGVLVLKISAGSVFFWVDKEDPKGTLETYFSK